MVAEPFGRFRFAPGHGCPFPELFDAVDDFAQGVADFGKWAAGLVVVFGDVCVGWDGASGEGGEVGIWGLDGIYGMVDGFVDPEFA